MNMQAEKKKTEKTGSTDARSRNTNSPEPHAKSGTSDKEALNGVSPRSPQITGHGKGRQTTKESAANAASANLQKTSVSDDKSGQASLAARNVKKYVKTKAAE